MKLKSLYFLCLFYLLTFAQNGYSQIEFLVTLDRTVGEHTIIDDLPTVNYIYTGATAYDQNGKRYVLRGIDFSGDVRLFCIDSNTGATLSEPLIPGSIGQLHYDNSTDILYALKISGGVMRIVSIDIPTATTTNIVDLPIVGYTGGSTYFDEANQNFVILNSGSFYTVNVETGEIVITPASASFSKLQYDNTNANLYGLIISGSTDLAHIDIAAESHTIIAEMPESGSSGISSFDEINQYYTYPSLSFLYTVDVLSGDILWEPIFPNVEVGENVIACHYDNESGILYALHWGNIDLPDSSYVLNDTICSGDIATLDLIGPGDYSWTTEEDPATILETGDILIVSPLTTTNYYALNDEDTILVTVVVIETSANFSITDTIGCPPLLVNHTDLSITSIGSISEWYWTFPDGDFSYLPNPSHTYYTSIYGTTTLEVTTDFGCSSTISIETNITVIPAPLAEFSYTPEDPTLEDELNFLDESLDPVTWEWSFGDDNYSILQNPTHSYSEIGTYNVMLKVSNEYCSDSIIKSLTIDEVVVGDVGVGDVIVGDVIEDDTIVDVIIPDEIIPIEIIPKETLPKEDLLFYIPNAFTPSSGDINNVFSPIFTSGYNPYNYHLTLFNREGQIIFESYDANFGWNGNYGYEPVSTGVFIWQVEFQLEDSSKKEVHRGHATLIR